MATAHNNAKKGEIAKTMLMCGDPLRAKFIAENYLENAKLVNEVRNTYCYTGTYKGKELSVMAHGMGVPSMGIYSYELFNEYDVDTIIRVGTCGSYQENVDVKDIVVAVAASTNSTYANQFELRGFYSANADFSLLKLADKTCDKLGVDAHFGNILTTDVFYDEDKEYYKRWAKLGVLAAEMETYALYVNANRANKKALTIMSVSDSLVTKIETTPEERQSGFTKMIEVALEIALEA